MEEPCGNHSVVCAGRNVQGSDESTKGKRDLLQIEWAEGASGRRRCLSEYSRDGRRSPCRERGEQNLPGSGIGTCKGGGRTSFGGRPVWADAWDEAEGISLSPPSRLLLKEGETEAAVSSTWEFRAWRGVRVLWLDENYPRTSYSELLCSANSTGNTAEVPLL